MDLSIVIVSYNTKELLKKCLESLISNIQYPISNYEIIVVDNGSEDGSREMINDQWLMVNKKKTKKSSAISHQPLVIKLIANPANIGFSKANNQGIKVAKGEYVMLLNSDTEIKAGALGNLVEFAQKYPEAGVVGSRLVNADGSIQPSVYHFPTILRAVKEYWLGQKGVYEKYAPKSKKAVEVEAVVGAAMLIPKKVIQKVGLLDERYFMYFEDLDFCRKVKKAGLKVCYLPDAEIIHHHGASGKEIPRETQQWLIQSSKIYHGTLKHYLINFIIWTGQKWQRFWEKIKI